MGFGVGLSVIWSNVVVIAWVVAEKWRFLYFKTFK